MKAYLYVRKRRNLHYIAMHFFYAFSRVQRWLFISLGMRSENLLSIAHSALCGWCWCTHNMYRHRHWPVIVFCALRTNFSHRERRKELQVSPENASAQQNSHTMQAKRHQMGVIKGVRVVIKFERGTKTMIAFHFDSHSNAAALIVSVWFVDLLLCFCLLCCTYPKLRIRCNVLALLAYQ